MSQPMTAQSQDFAETRENAQILVHGAVKLVSLVQHWRDRVRTRRALLALDDHMLADIGLSRCDALREAAKPMLKD